MIRVIGARRILTLAVLIGLNLDIAGMVYLYLTPEILKKDRELKGVALGARHRRWIATGPGGASRAVRDVERSFFDHPRHLAIGR